MRKEDIAARIPHSGPMCLLDEVVQWDTHAIRCRSQLGLKASHPLAVRGELTAPHLIEYAAQAAALHSGLCRESDGGADVPGGVIAAVKRVEFAAFRLGADVTALDILATCEVAAPNGLMYRFAVLNDDQPLCEGRFTIARV